MLRKKTFTSLNIGAGSVKAVTINIGRDRPKITNMGIAPIPSGVFEEGFIKDTNLVASAITEALLQGGIKDKNIITALSGDNIISRELEMPIMSSEELQEALMWEADEFLPFSVDEANLDHVVLEEKGEQVSVLLVAANKELVENFIEPIKKAKLKPKSLNIEPFALHALLKNHKNSNGKNLAMIDIGSSHTVILLLKGERVELIRTLPIGGQDFTQALEETFELSTERAEEIKIQLAMVDENQDLTEEGISYESIRNVLLQQSLHLLDEISRSFNYFQVQQRGENLQQIYLSGGGSLLNGLIDSLYTELEVPVEILDPLEDIELDRSFNQTIMANIPSFSVAVGLILCELME